MKAKLILFALPLLLASCGTPTSSDNIMGEGSNPESGNVSSPSSGGKKSLSILFHVDAQSAEGIAYKKRLDAFNNAYASQGLKVSGSFKARTTGVSTYETELTQMKTQGTLPDIITFDAPMCAKYAKEEILVDITNKLTQEELDPFLTTNTYQGKLYGLPIQESSAGFYYNKKLFAQAGIDVSAYTAENPWTFAQFKDVCAKLAAKGITPADMRLDATKDETATYLLYPFVYAAGGEFLSQDGWTAKGYLDSDASKKGFQFLKDCISSNYTSFAINPTDFFTGKVGMYLSSGWTIPDLDKKYKETFPDRDSWGLLPYPMDAQKASATGSWCFGVTNNGTKDKTNAVTLLKFLTSAESSAGITGTTGMISARKDVPGADGAPETMLRTQLATSGRARPESVGYSEFSATFGTIIASLKSKEVNDVVSSQATTLNNKLRDLKDLY